jgi:hypothetical protein
MIHRRECLAAIVMALTCSALYGQAPRPFPQPSQPRPGQPAKPAPAPPTTQPITKPAAASDVPSETMLGVPIYPSAQYITSYDAGRGQRFYLFGANVAFAEMVNYYRTTLKSRGEVLFEAPPTHQFETARFRDETMAFPPSVTIKDYTYGGSAGYPNPKRGTAPERFATIIQIVPAPQ